jgi:hypothetical protein
MVWQKETFSIVLWKRVTFFLIYKGKPLIPSMFVAPHLRQKMF